MLVNAVYITTSNIFYRKKGFEQYSLLESSYTRFLCIGDNRNTFQAFGVKYLNNIIVSLFLIIIVLYNRKRHFVICIDEIPYFSLFIDPIAR